MAKTAQQPAPAPSPSPAAAAAAAPAPSPRSNPFLGVAEGAERSTTAAAIAAAAVRGAARAQEALGALPPAAGEWCLSPGVASILGLAAEAARLKARRAAAQAVVARAAAKALDEDLAAGATTPTSSSAAH
jgi:hypothetical protein